MLPLLATVRVLRPATLLVAPTFFIAVFVVVALLRIDYPYELEWMEGGTLAHVQRVAEGEPLYIAPSVAFTPFIYTPLYYVVAAGVGGLVEGFAALRLVSLLSTLGCCALLAVLGRKESGAWTAGLMAAGLFAATFEIAGSWMDLGRVDALFVFLVLAGATIARLRATAFGLAMAGALLGLAFLTKQSALVIAVPVGLWALLAHRGLARAALLAAFAVVVIGSTLVLEVQTQGWFSYYVFDLPSGHALVPSMIVSFWTANILRPLSLAALATIIFFGGARPDQRAFYGWLLAGVLIASYASRVHEGGHVNVLLPAYAGLALGFGLGVEKALAWAAVHGLRAEGVALLAVAVQFGGLVYNPADQIPTAADRAAGDALVETIRAIPGDVLVLWHPYLAERAGKASYAHEMAMYDVWRGSADGRRMLDAELQSAMRDGRFSAIVLNEPWWGATGAFAEHYCLEGPVLTQPRVFWPVAGHRTRPSELYLRCEPEP